MWRQLICTVIILTDLFVTQFSFQFILYVYKQTRNLLTKLNSPLSEVCTQTPHVILSLLYYFYVVLLDIVVYHFEVPFLLSLVRSKRNKRYYL